MVKVMAKRNKNSSQGLLFLVAVVVVLGVWGVLSSMNQVESTLRVQGYKNIQVGTYAMWACTETEGPTVWSTSFTATRNGHHVEGAVCCAATCQVRQY